MNKFIEAVTSFDAAEVDRLLRTGDRWRTWSQPDGKNALHFLCATPIVADPTVPAEQLKHPDPAKVAASLTILKALIKNGLDINSIHRIPDKNCGHFPATPVWYAYTRGRDEKLYTWLLKNGGSANNCLFAITWYDDVKAANLFRKHGALYQAASSEIAGGVELVSQCLFAAISWKKFRMADWLLKNGADSNIMDPKGNTPLQYVVKKKYQLNAIKLLLRNGADPDRKNPKGESARSIAARYRDKTILELIEGS